MNLPWNTILHTRNAFAGNATDIRRLYRPILLRLLLLEFLILPVHCDPKDGLFATSTKWHALLNSGVKMRLHLSKNKLGYGKMVQFLTLFFCYSRHYQDAYEMLIIMFGSTAILPPRTKRWAEAKVLADCINIKVFIFKLP